MKNNLGNLHPAPFIDRETDNEQLATGKGITLCP